MGNVSKDYHAAVALAEASEPMQEGVQLGRLQAATPMRAPLASNLKDDASRPARNNSAGSAVKITNVPRVSPVAAGHVEETEAIRTPAQAERRAVSPTSAYLVFKSTFVALHMVRKV